MSWDSLEQVELSGDYWDSLDRASQLGTLLGELGELDNWIGLFQSGQYWPVKGWFADECQQ